MITAGGKESLKNTARKCPNPPRRFPVRPVASQTSSKADRRHELDMTLTPRLTAKKARHTRFWRKCGYEDFCPNRYFLLPNPHFGLLPI